MKFKTVREGEEAVIYNHLGQGKVVVGPHRVFLFRKRLYMLKHHVASQYQYLQVTYNTGTVQHLEGPCEMYCNPLEHSSIIVSDAIKIDANHMIVVYHRLQNLNTERQIIQGPRLFMPTAEEWLHKFSWHGQDSQQIGHMIPCHKKFEQLEVIPDQFYYDVRDVRTTDDTMLTVKLMVFYELSDVIKMLETTQDPIADMINAVCSDVIAFAGKLNFQQFLEATTGLSEMETYLQLSQRTDRIGYTVSKVVYRGYQASDQLQAMQDSSIQSRTELRLNAELQEQKQKLLDFRLQKEQDRSNLTQEMERQKVEHRQMVDKTKKSHQIALRDHELTTRIECDNIYHDARLEYDEKRGKQQVGYLKSLHNLEVKLTDYLVHQGPVKVDQELHIVPRTVKPGNTTF